MTEVSRRKVLKATAAAGVAAVVARGVPAQEKALAPTWHKRVIEYLVRHARADGGYGWEGQDRSHLTPTFAVIGCYKLLGHEPPNKAALAQFVRTHHPMELKKLEQEHRAFDWQQIQSLVWLGEDVSDFRAIVRSWKAPFAYPKQYEQHGWPVFQQEVAPILSRKLVGLPMDDIPAAFVDYVNSRRRPNGSFNSAPANSGGDGHILNTWWGLQALDALAGGGHEVKWLKVQLIAWLRECQTSFGGFSYQPRGEIGAGKDVAYTWAGVRSLALLGEKSLWPNDCVTYLHSLWRADGGFADREDWLSNPLATYYAIDSLQALSALTNDAGKLPGAHRVRPNAPVNLKVFSIQLEAHGQGSPSEAVDLADNLRIHLWGAKNAKPEWIACAEALARGQAADVKFFVANEEYGTWIDVPGLGTYSHMSDIVAPAGMQIGRSLAAPEPVSWPEFRRMRRDPLIRASGFLIWQFGENEPLVRMLLDDSIKQGGFAAISTFHFGNPDFTNSDPMLMRYRGQLPFVALQDAHGPEPWWFADMTEGFRTLFLATKPTWGGWLEAVRNNWVVAVRHDAVSGGQTWMHGTPEVIDVVRKQWRSWQWWDNPAIKRPLVSIVAIKPGDEFEVGRPERGVAIRVRCAWQNTTQGLPKKPLTELVKLMVAGKQVEPEHVIRRRPNDAIEDEYYLYKWSEAPHGKYTASVTVRNIKPQAESCRPIEFVV